VSRFRLAPRLALTTLAILLLVRGVATLAAAAPAADEDLDRLRDQIAQVRGLSYKSAPRVASIDRAALATRLARDFDTPKAVRDALTTQMLLEVLGASTPSVDLRALQKRAFAEQAVASYDQDEHTLYQASDGSVTAADRLRLVHELTHALQDQSFDLGRILPEAPQNADAALAAQALAEGDAMLTMRLWGRQFLRPDEKRTLGDGSAASDPLFEGVPTFVRGELLFPYEAGASFAQRLYQDGGFEALNRAFFDPPRSTEQILHPEKYASKHPPIPVTIPVLDPWVAGTWRTLRTDVFGEIGLRLLLEPHVGYPTAETAAAGWGGDAYTILEDGDGRRIVAVSTAWDTEPDAAEFYGAYVSAITARFGANASRTINEPSRARWSVPGYQVQVLKTDTRVRVIYGPDDWSVEVVDGLLG
jgi:hypothetical protein